MSAKTQLKQMGILFGVALLFRFFLSGIDTTLWVDSYSYLKTAEALVTGNWVHTHIDRTPGYPLLIALVSILTGPKTLVPALAGINAFLGALIPIFVYRLSWRIFGQAPLAFVTGLLAAVLPMPVQYEHSVLSETLYSFSLLLYAEWLLRCLNRPGQLIGWGVLGLLGGWLMWVRPVGCAALIATLVLLCNFPAFTLKRLIVLLASWGIFLVSWIGFNAGVHQAPIFSAGSGANQLYKTIQWVNWTSPPQAYKEHLQRRVEANPSDFAYRAVNDVHVQMMQAPQNQGIPYTKLYLQHDTAARQVSNEAMWLHPIQYFVITVQEGFKLWITPDGWDPYHLIGYPFILLGLIGLCFCYHWKVRTPLLDKILLGAFGLFMVLNVTDQGLRQIFHIAFPEAIQALSMPIFLMVLLMLWFMNRLTPEDEHSWSAYALGLLVIAHSLLTPISSISDSRYRVPLEPLLLLFAAYAAIELYHFGFSASASKKSVDTTPTESEAH